MSEERRPALPAIPVAARRRGALLRRHPLLETALTYDDRRLDFEAFAAAMITDLNPQGPLETTIAARIISLSWRLNRAQNLEAAFLSRSKYSGADATPIDEALSKGRDIQLLDGMQRWETSLQRNLIGALDQLRLIQVTRKERSSSPNTPYTQRSDTEGPAGVT